MRRMGRVGWMVGLALAAGACDRGASPAARGGDLTSAATLPPGELCDVVQQPTPLPDAVHEASGVAASRRHRGVFWTHNDSKNPYLFAVNRSGKALGRVAVTGAAKGDMEDLQIAPCAGGDCLYLADIGDNNADRDEVAVYRVPEPAPNALRTAPAERFAARYPDGPQDAEALFVLPPSRMYIVTKGETGPIALYAFPAAPSPGASSLLQRLRVLAPKRVDRARRVTGASASPDGRWVALRTLDSLFIYPAAALVSGGKLDPWKADLRALRETQGEGINLSNDGAIVLTSEGGKGKKKQLPATLARLECSFSPP